MASLDAHILIAYYRIFVMEKNIMTHHLIVYLCLGAGLASALVSGVFLSFSDFVMRGLIAAEPTGGIEVMQQINRTVFRSIFLATFIALVPLTLGLAIYAGFKLSGPDRILIVVGAGIYIVFAFFVTIVGNVPMNEKLEAMSAVGAEAQTYWVTYGRVWTWWNHLRTLGSAATALCLLLAALALS